MNIYLTTIIESINYYIKTLPQITLSGIFEIIILAFIIYKILFWVGESKAFSLLRGLIVITAFVLFAYAFHLDVILEILKQIASVLIIAVVILFKEEIRAAIERLGRHHWFNHFFASQRKLVNNEKIVSELCKAVFSMSKVKTGALIVIEKNDSLFTIIDSGIEVDAKISNQLLINIFEKNTPLHDGAVIISEDKVKAATCYLPLSKNYDISKSYGTRHRAALGISEVSDCITIVVSEETGRVSIAQDGVLKTINNENELKDILIKTIYHQEEVENHNFIDMVKGWFNNAN